MSKFFILLFIPFMIFAGEKGCHKDLCVDDTVRDIYGYKGVIQSFDKENKMVNVLLEHIPSVWAFPEDELGRKVSCLKNICSGENVVEIEDSRNMMMVYEVYTHGLVYVYSYYHGGYFLYNINELKK